MQALAFRTVAGLCPFRPKCGRHSPRAKPRACLHFFFTLGGLPISPASTQKNKVKSQIKNMAVTILSRLGAVVVALAA